MIVYTNIFVIKRCSGVGTDSGVTLQHEGGGEKMASTRKGVW